MVATLDWGDSRLGVATIDWGCRSRTATRDWGHPLGVGASSGCDSRLEGEDGGLLSMKALERRGRLMQPLQPFGGNFNKFGIPLVPGRADSEKVKVRPR